MGRKSSRELTMKLLYQNEFRREDSDTQLQEVLSYENVSDSDRDFICEIFNGVNVNLKNIDELIEQNAIGWKFSRISKVDLSILRLSIFEILYRNDIPLNVTINEAVELAKKYSTIESGSFINGMLGKVSKISPKDNGEFSQTSN